MDQPENNPFKYRSQTVFPDSKQSHQERLVATGKGMAWTAPEFIEHHHPPGWYASLAASTLAVAALVYFLTRDLFATVTILIIGLIVWVFAGHKPAQSSNEITAHGISINRKSYPFSLFKSYTILHEASLSSLNLLPLKRFTPPVTAYFDPALEQRITDAIGDHLPTEERPMDGIDRLAHRLRL